MKSELLSRTMAVGGVPLTEIRNEEALNKWSAVSHLFIASRNSATSSALVSVYEENLRADIDHIKFKI